MSDLALIIATWCMSEWEGCGCNLPKGHGPAQLHHCASCPSEWTDAQAAEWWEFFKTEMRIK